MRNFSSHPTSIYIQLISVHTGIYILINSINIENTLPRKIHFNNLQHARPLYSILPVLIESKCDLVLYPCSFLIWLFTIRVSTSLENKSYRHRGCLIGEDKTL